MPIYALTLSDGTTDMVAADTPTHALTTYIAARKHNAGVVGHAAIVSVTRIAHHGGTPTVELSDLDSLAI